MRRVFIVMLILLHSMVSLAVVGADATPPHARSSELDVIGLNQFTLHQNELIEVLFTLHNTGDDDDTYSFQLESEVSGLVATGVGAPAYTQWDVRNAGRVRRGWVERDVEPVAARSRRPQPPCQQERRRPGVLRRPDRVPPALEQPDDIPLLRPGAILHVVDLPAGQGLRVALPVRRPLSD